MYGTLRGASDPVGMIDPPFSASSLVSVDRLSLSFGFLRAYGARVASERSVRTESAPFVR
jgi:hypothetical protein